MAHFQPTKNTFTCACAGYHGTPCLLQCATGILAPAHSVTASPSGSSWRVQSVLGYCEGWVYLLWRLILCYTLSQQGRVIKKRQID